MIGGELAVLAIMEVFTPAATDTIQVRFIDHDWNHSFSMTQSLKFSFLGHLLPHKWENCLTVDKKSWGFRRNMTSADLMTIHELVTELVRTVR